MTRNSCIVCDVLRKVRCGCKEVNGECGRGVALAIAFGVDEIALSDLVLCFDNHAAWVKCARDDLYTRRNSGVSALAVLRRTRDYQLNERQQSALDSQEGSCGSGSLYADRRDAGGEQVPCGFNADGSLNPKGFFHRQGPLFARLSREC